MLSVPPFELSRMILGEVSPPSVGVGVVERGGLGLLDTGDVALDTILDPGTDAEKNFFEVPDAGLKDFEMFRAPQRDVPFGIGDTRLPMNSNFLFFLEDLFSICLKDSIEEILGICTFDFGSNLSSSVISVNPLIIFPLLLAAE